MVKKDIDTKEIKALFRKIKEVKSDLAAQIEKLNAEQYYSDAWKREQKSKATDEAMRTLAEISESADEIVAAFEDQLKGYRAFDYSDPRLIAAVQLILATDGAIPKDAWRQIITDFSEKPAELGYLRDVFEKSGATEAALMANEALRGSGISETLPLRVSDAIYYACQTPVETNISEITAEIDAIGEE